MSPVGLKVGFMDYIRRQSYGLDELDYQADHGANNSRAIAAKCWNSGLQNKTSMGFCLMILEIKRNCQVGSLENFSFLHFSSPSAEIHLPTFFMFLFLTSP